MLMYYHQYIIYVHHSCRRRPLGLSASGGAHGQPWLSLRWTWRHYVIMCAAGDRSWKWFMKVIKCSPPLCSVLTLGSASADVLALQSEPVQCSPGEIAQWIRLTLKKLELGRYGCLNHSILLSPYNWIIQTLWYGGIAPLKHRTIMT